MGKGRKPLPAALRILTGLPSHSGYGGPASPAPSPGVPDEPKHLSGVALEFWHVLASSLGAAGLLDKLDAVAMQAVCIAYARAVEADRLVAEQGILIDDRHGLRKNPAVAVSNESWAAFRSFISEFGLSPAARARLKLPRHDRQIDEFEAFQSQQ